MKMFEQLKSHLDSTPIEILQKEWREVENTFYQGVNAFEYLEYSNGAYWNWDSPGTICNTEISSKLTSDFSGSFFLV